jgi:hypothetical protein
MPTKSGRTTEAEIGEAVLTICANTATGECSIADLKQEIPEYIDLTPEDRAQSVTRPNEEMWEQQVRNLISHRETPGNIICDGHAEYTGNAIRITAAGRLRIKG